MSQITSTLADNQLHRSLTLPNDVAATPELATFVEEVAETLQIDMLLTMNLTLALEEAVVNVMNYAYAEGTVGQVNILATSDGHRLRFVITDSGKPFDPTKVAEADTTLSVEERPVGGLGIFLVKKIMDVVSYEYTDGQNVLTLEKTLSGGGQ